MRLEGVFVANITPFGADGRVSYESLKSHLEFLLENGVHGFVPCGTTGESSTLTLEEWREVIITTRKVANTRGLKVIAGCGGNCTWMVLERIREAKDLGCDAALVVTPYYNKPTPRGLLAHFEHLAERGGIPLVLYNVPSRTGVNLSVDLAARLLQHPNIVGIKEASGKHNDWVALSGAVNLAEKSLLAGDDDAFAVIRALGGSGIISASANVIPAHFVRIENLMREGRVPEAFSLQKKIHALIQALFLETNPAPVKQALQIIGRGEANLRLPLVPVTTETQVVIEHALAGLELGA